MKYSLLVAAGLALASCATHKQLTAPPPASLPTSGGRSEQAGLDSIIVAREPNLFDKLMGRTPKPFVVPVNVATPISIGRKSTANFYYGPATVTTNTVGKKGALASGTGASVKGDTKAKGGSVVSQDSSVSNALTGGGDLAGANGAGSQVTQTVPPPEPKLTAWQKFKADLATVWDTVKWPLVAVVGAFGVGAAICALAPTSAAGLWLAGLVKRKSSKTATV